MATRCGCAWRGLRTKFRSRISQTCILSLSSLLVAIFLAFFFGSNFTDKLTNGYSLGMAIAFAAALACYVIGLYAASTRRGGPS